MSLRTMHLQDLNAHIMCVLCGGYLVDATTIVECLHSCKFSNTYWIYLAFYCFVCEKLYYDIKGVKKLWCCVGGGNKVIWVHQLS